MTHITLIFQGLCIEVKLGFLKYVWSVHAQWQDKVLWFTHVPRVSTWRARISGLRSRTKNFNFFFIVLRKLKPMLWSEKVHMYCCQINAIWTCNQYIIYVSAKIRSTRICGQNNPSPKSWKKRVRIRDWKHLGKHFSILHICRLNFC